MTELRQEYIPARRRPRRLTPERPAVTWTRWERVMLAFTIGGMSLMATIVLGALLIAELIVLWAFIS